MPSTATQLTTVVCTKRPAAVAVRLDQDTAARLYDRAAREILQAQGAQIAETCRDHLDSKYGPTFEDTYGEDRFKRPDIKAELERMVAERIANASLELNQAQFETQDPNVVAVTYELHARSRQMIARGERPLADGPFKVHISPHGHIALHGKFSTPGTAELEVAIRKMRVNLCVRVIDGIEILGPQKELDADSVPGGRSKSGHRAVVPVRLRAQTTDGEPEPGCSLFVRCPMNGASFFRMRADGGRTELGSLFIDTGMDGATDLFYLAVPFDQEGSVDVPLIVRPNAGGFPDQALTLAVNLPAVRPEEPADDGSAAWTPEQEDWLNNQSATDQVDDEDVDFEEVHPRRLLGVFAAAAGMAAMFAVFCAGTTVLYTVPEIAIALREAAIDPILRMPAWANAPASPKPEPELVAKVEPAPAQAPEPAPKPEPVAPPAPVAVAAVIVPHIACKDMTFGSGPNSQTFLVYSRCTGTTGSLRCPLEGFNPDGTIRYTPADCVKR